MVNTIGDNWSMGGLSCWENNLGDDPCINPCKGSDE